VAVENPAVCSTTANACTNGTPSGQSCTGSTAEWTCTASNGSAVACTANTTSCDPFNCGEANGGNYHYSDFDSSNPNLCVGGSATDFDYHVASNTWTWTC
jgi:hypothetical protein